jgi:FkbM family methyltransferase
MGFVDRLPARTLKWAGRLQFRPVIGPVVSTLSARLLHRPRVVRYGQAAGLRIDPAGAAAGYAFGTSEPLIQDVFAEHIPSGGVVWDIGANIGFYTLIASRHVGRGHVVAFEPLPENQRSIRRNLALNAVTNVEVVGVALGDHEGTASLALHESPTWAKLDTSADTAFKRDAAATSHIEVPLSTIDAQLERFTPPDLVKMDIEGAEVAALRGASRLLTEVRPTLICEFHGTNAAVSALLESHDYELRTVERPDVPPALAEWYMHVLAVPVPK